MALLWTRFLCRAIVRSTRRLYVVYKEALELKRTANFIFFKDLRLSDMTAGVDIRVSKFADPFLHSALLSRTTETVECLVGMPL